MARLSQADVTKAIASGETARLFDGNSLSLHVRGGSALWEYQFRDGQKMRTLSLGSAADMSPAAARRAREDKAAERRKGRIARRGLAVINSLGNRAQTASGEKRAQPESKPMRLADIVESFIALKASDWKVKSREPGNYRHLKTGALGKLWAHEINHSDVETELQTRWGDALANAHKYRIRIECLIDHAVAKNARADGPNPARKEIIKQLIAAAPETVHRPAMKFAEVPAFYRDLMADGSPAARSLAFAILTVARNREARRADWSEITEDFCWIIPGGREERSMKQGEEHAVPLSPAALVLLGKPKKTGLIFGEMHKNALLDKLHSMREGLTVHGMRTSFTSWARKNGFEKALRDLAKAHKVVQSANDAAYERHDERAEQLDTLRPMLQSWSDFVTGQQSI
jgi:integrase